MKTHEVLVTELSSNDVLCGRGGCINAYPGNLQFRTIISKVKESYRASKTNSDKLKIVYRVVETIRNMDPPGRFLKEHPEISDCWVEIGDDKAKNKVVQAMRPKISKGHSGRRRRKSTDSEFSSGTISTTNTASTAPSSNRSSFVGMRSSSILDMRSSIVDMEGRQLRVLPDNESQVYKLPVSFNHQQHERILPSRSSITSSVEAKYNDRSYSIKVQSGKHQFLEDHRDMPPPFHLSPSSSSAEAVATAHSQSFTQHRPLTSICMPHSAVENIISGVTYPIDSNRISMIHSDDFGDGQAMLESKISSLQLDESSHTYQQGHRRGKSLESLVGESFPDQTKKQTATNGEFLEPFPGDQTEKQIANEEFLEPFPGGQTKKQIANEEFLEPFPGGQTKIQIEESFTVENNIKQMNSAEEKWIPSNMDSLISFPGTPEIPNVESLDGNDDVEEKYKPEKCSSFFAPIVSTINSWEERQNQYKRLKSEPSTLPPLMLVALSSLKRNKLLNSLRRESLMRESLLSLSRLSVEMNSIASEIISGTRVSKFLDHSNRSSSMMSRELIDDLIADLYAGGDHEFNTDLETIICDEEKVSI